MRQVPSRVASSAETVRALVQRPPAVGEIRVSLTIGILLALLEEVC